MIDSYEQIAKDYKVRVQESSLSKAQERQFQADPKVWKREKIDELMGETGWMNLVENSSGKMTIDSISRYFDVKPNMGRQLKEEIMARRKNGKKREDPTV